jgi:hypothetical protein
MDHLVNANVLLSKWIGKLYIEGIEELVDEVNHEKIERDNLVKAQKMLCAVMMHCQAHDINCAFHDHDCGVDE